MIERIHDGERNATLEAIGDQAKELHEQPGEKSVTCPCGTTGPLTRMFRCFYCEVWFCPGCAKPHFEDDHPEPPPLPKEVIQGLAEIQHDYPLFDLIEVHTDIGDDPDHAVPLDGLREELDVIEESVDQEFEKGMVTAETRLGALVAVYGLRDTLRRVEDA